MNIELVTYSAVAAAFHYVMAETLYIGLTAAVFTYTHLLLIG